MIIEILHVMKLELLLFRPVVRIHILLEKIIMHMIRSKYINLNLLDLLMPKCNGIC